jgi:PrtD family type I secretion system ABC transporter
MTGPATEGPAAELRRARGILLGVALFSAAINLLMLTGPLFMLQVYDRVLGSGSVETLAVLFSLVVFLYGLMGFLDHVRGRTLARLGAGFQAGLDGRVFGAVLRQAEHPGLRERPATGLGDLAAVRTLLASPVMGALFDLPWTPLYFAVLFLFHPLLGWAGIAGGLVILALALWNQATTRGLQAEAAKQAAEAEARTERTRREIETVRGLGMTARLTAHWAEARDAALKAHIAASDAGGGFTAATKAFRLLLQSAMLALGAWLVLQGQLGAGAMIAGSILLGRALAPIEQVVGQWGMVQKARAAWTRLEKLLEAAQDPAPPMPLPAPEARLAVRDLAVAAPGERRALIAGVSFAVGPGEAVAVIGPSAAGKSTLARALTGLWPPAQGEIRLSGADLHQYDRDVLGLSLGYLPQEVVLFPGTVAENIARFAADARPGDIVAAARAAAAHELILQLPDGYDTRLTEGGGRLSGGQRQRIALARAFYGAPPVLILDEPNAALDDQGVQALNAAIAGAKAQGRAVLIMAHRPSALAECTHVLMLDGGRMRAFGPRDEVLAKLVKGGPQVVPAAKGTG